ncbi:MAG: hypothetical protein N3B01_11960, partial [Verrucomicrobiae bacterium]|nr:hypothetical protein [Verrucomicrobiae bacterium]
PASTADWYLTAHNVVDNNFIHDGGKLFRAACGVFLGGSASDGAEGVELDPQGRVCVGGMTYSADFPVTVGAFQKRFAGARNPHGPLWGGGDGTVTVFSPDLSQLLFSSYMGGSGEDLFRACAVTARGEIVLVGSTTSTDFPVLNAQQPAPAGGPDEVIVVKLRPISAKTN